MEIVQEAGAHLPRPVLEVTSTVGERKVYSQATWQPFEKAVMQLSPERLETLDSMRETGKRLKAVKAARKKNNATKRTMVAATWVISKGCKYFLVAGASVTKSQEVITDIQQPKNELAAVLENTEIL